MISSDVDLRFATSADVIAREIGEELILVPIRAGIGDLDSVYIFNATAAFVWCLIDGQRKVSDIVQMVIAELEVDQLTAADDVLELLTQLKSIGAIEPV